MSIPSVQKFAISAKEQGIYNPEQYKALDYKSKPADAVLTITFTHKTNDMKKTFSIFTLLIIFMMPACSDQTNTKAGTNKNPAIKELTKEKKELKTSIDAAIEILTTSQAYLKKTKGLYEAVVKNGGTSFGITVESSPNPKIDGALSYSKTYDFSLHESYSDRMPVIANYTFNPADQQLYEYDAAEDKQNPIDFDKNLLLKFNNLCK